MNVFFSGKTSADNVAHLSALVIEKMGLNVLVCEQGVPARQVTGAQGEIPPFKKNGRFVDANAMAETCSYETGVTRGTLLVWGLNFYTATPGECCEACRRFPGCNVWKYCTSEEGECSNRILSLVAVVFCMVNSLNQVIIIYLVFFHAYRSGVLYEGFSCLFLLIKCTHIQVHC